MLQRYGKLLVVIGSSFTAFGAAHGEASRWSRVGQTDSSCSFQAQLDLLEGYPFARLQLAETEAETTISLAVSDQAGCQSVGYSQVPEAALPPTFEVLGTDLCLDRLPTYSIVRSLSGVRETCRVVE
jgi:hypothetical protein